MDINAYENCLCLSKIFERVVSQYGCMIFLLLESKC